MLEAQIPKDIRKYESKFVLMFTLRQFICLIVAGVVAFILYQLTKDIFGSTTASYICFISAIPEVLIGWVKVQGIPFEKFVQTAFISNVLAKPTRVYEIKNPYRKALKPINKLSPKEYKKTLKQRKALAASNPDYQFYT